MALFALTGLGNAVLRHLLSKGIVPKILVTRNEPRPFPYYDEIDLSVEATANKIPVMYGLEGEKFVENSALDVIFVASYHRLLKPALISSARHAINFHPSLLPKYRGASPFYWVLRNGEKTTGVTAHFLAADADAGDILLQESIDITLPETQGTLRKKLAELTGRLAVDVVKNIQAGSLRPAVQDESQATYYPRVTPEVCKIQTDWSDVEIERHTRALSPYPGVIQIDGPVEPT